MILGLLDEAEAAGARRERACEVLGVEPRTVQRWRRQGGGEDGRLGPKGTPTNALSAAERAEVLAAANAPEHRDLSPKQIVPRLADRGEYVASESTFYRVLRAHGQLTHRGRARPPQPRPAPSHVATSPNRIWVWDISVPQKAAKEMRDMAPRHRLAGAGGKPPQAARVKSPGRERCGKGASRHQVRTSEGEHT